MPACPLGITGDGEAAYGAPWLVGKGSPDGRGDGCTLVVPPSLVPSAFAGGSPFCTGFVNVAGGVFWTVVDSYLARNRCASNKAFRRAGMLSSFSRRPLQMEWIELGYPNWTRRDHVARERALWTRAAERTGGCRSHLRIFPRRAWLSARLGR